MVKVIELATESAQDGLFYSEVLMFTFNYINLFFIFGICGIIVIFIAKISKQNKDQQYYTRLSIALGAVTGLAGMIATVAFIILFLKWVGENSKTAMALYAIPTDFRDIAEYMKAHADNSDTSLYGLWLACKLFVASSSVGTIPTLIIGAVKNYAKHGLMQR